jgi:hypothetical protein
MSQLKPQKYVPSINILPPANRKSHYISMLKCGRENIFVIGRSSTPLDVFTDTTLVLPSAPGWM